MGETPIRPLPGSEHVSGAAGASKLPQVDSTASSPAFEVLLEKLEARARELRDDSGNVDNPTELAGAVDRARASLEDALTLSDQLLEAYRQSLQQRTGE
jgi:hypothetical protein